ncbi:unnamed protein product [Arctia plantaginis]|uniref:Uncharacterized protein n=1 Tax=Arctia plantaginis TaxID=874455 RepID=A0A8S1BH84_ARCPL|nr:unnamed protein product [Arctia plantaginis]
MEFSDYATYLRSASECDHRAVIIIISRLIIVIRRRRSLSPTDKRSVRPDNAAFDSRAVLNAIVAIVREQGEVVPFVLLCVPGYRIVVTGLFHSTRFNRTVLSDSRTNQISTYI